MLERERPDLVSICTSARPRAGVLLDVRMELPLADRSLRIFSRETVGDSEPAAVRAARRRAGGA